MKSIIGRAAGLAGLASLALAAPAAAHITTDPAEAPSDGYATVSFQIPHGCEESPTTQFSVQIPPSVASATPAISPNWTIRTKEGKKDPVELHGEKVTTGVSEVTYTAKTPLPADRLDFVYLSLKMPAGPGESIYFPTVQKCEQGETRWIQIPAEGESEDDLESPAPAVVLTAADGEHGGAAAAGRSPPHTWSRRAPASIRPGRPSTTTRLQSGSRSSHSCTPNACRYDFQGSDAFLSFSRTLRVGIDGPRAPWHGPRPPDRSPRAGEPSPPPAPAAASTWDSRRVGGRSDRAQRLELIGADARSPPRPGRSDPRGGALLRQRPTASTRARTSSRWQGFVAEIIGAAAGRARAGRRSTDPVQPTIPSPGRAGPTRWRNPTLLRRAGRGPRPAH